MIKLLFSENVTMLPRSKAKIAAGFLVLTTVQYNPAIDVARAKQAKVFEEPATFVQPMRASNLVVLRGVTTYNPATDVRRKVNPFFPEVESYLKTQPGTVGFLTTYTTPPQFFASSRSVLTESISHVKAQRGTLNVLSQVVAQGVNADILMGQDTYGWPAFEDPWCPPMRGTRVVTDTFTTYNPATDVRRATQAKFFEEPATFTPPVHLNYVINNTVVYNPNADVRFTRQARYFADPDAFVKTKAPLSVAINFTPYAPASDVRRATQARYFEDQAAYPQRAPFNALITNGLVQISPLEFATTLDIYDGFNGTLQLAWGQFNPKPQSYNVYVTPLSISQIPELGLENDSLLLVESGQALALESAPSIPDVFYGSTNGLLMTVTGLTPTTYVNGVVSNSGTYVVKVVAVTNGKERGEVSKVVTVNPSSIMLVTAMKRLWPFGEDGS